jgi:hypothetical protein
MHAYRWTAVAHVHILADEKVPSTHDILCIQQRWMWLSPETVPVTNKRRDLMHHVPTNKRRDLMHHVPTNKRRDLMHHVSCMQLKDHISRALTLFQGLNYAYTPLHKRHGARMLHVFHAAVKYVWIWCIHVCMCVCDAYWGLGYTPMAQNALTWKVLNWRGAWCNMGTFMQLYVKPYNYTCMHSTQIAHYASHVHTCHMFHVARVCVCTHV